MNVSIWQIKYCRQYDQVMILFGRNIAGLVTKYGSANSHMAIRTAEVGLPAVIGVGEQKFNEIVTANVLEIDCSSQLIRKVR